MDLIFHSHKTAFEGKKQKAQEKQLQNSEVSFFFKADLVIVPWLDSCTPFVKMYKASSF